MRNRFGDFLRIGNIGMTNSPLVKDLLVLTADPTMQSTIQTLLEKRRNALGISSFTVDFQTHRHRDSGCRTAPGLVINPLQNRYRRAMVVFDFHGSGESRRTASQLEIDLERDLGNAGWGSDGVAVVSIDPELEAWVFGSSAVHLEEVIGWSQRQSIREWLEINGHVSVGVPKPTDPQTAFDEMLRLHGTRRSRTLFAKLARRVSLARCQDRAFQKFRTTLQRWFPAQ